MKKRPLIVFHSLTGLMLTIRLGTFKPQALDPTKAQLMMACVMGHSLGINWHEACLASY